MQIRRKLARFFLDHIPEAETYPHNGQGLALLGLEKTDQEGLHYLTRNYFFFSTYNCFFPLSYSVLDYDLSQSLQYMRIIEVPNMARFLLLYIKSAKIIDFLWPPRP